MDILFIIYIFALFVIFSPNFIFHYNKSNNIMVAIIHALLFSVVVYVTYSSVINKQKEGATIGTFEKNDVSIPLNVNEMNLGNVMNDPTDESKKKNAIFNNDIVVSSPTSAEEDKLIAMPPYDYSNFRSYDYDNMQKKLKMLESHKHTNHYFDLVPNFNETRHEILCAADYGTSKPCCRQPNAYIPESNQCDALKPYCMDYIAGKQWGKCVSENPYPKPNLVYDGVINSPSVSPVVVNKPSPIHLYQFKENNSRVAMDTNDHKNIEKKNGNLIGDFIKIEDDALTFSNENIDQSYEKQSYLELPINITGNSKILSFETRVTTSDINKAWARIFQFGKGENKNDGNINSFILCRWNGNDEYKGNLSVSIVPSNGPYYNLQKTNTKFNGLNDAHIVLVINSETNDVKLYVNKVLVITGNPDFDLTPIITNTTKNYLGHSINVHDVGFNGIIHEFAIWDIELFASSSPPVVVKKPTGGESPAETETKPDGTVVVKNCPVLPVKSAPAPACPAVPLPSYLNTNSFCDGGKIFINATNYTTISTTQENEENCAKKCEDDKSCDMYLMQNENTCWTYKDVSDISMFCNQGNDPVPHMFWGKVKTSVANSIKKYPQNVKSAVSTFMMMVGKGNSSMLYSENGYVWNEVPNLKAYDVAYNGSMWVSTFSGGKYSIAYSSDGKTWTSSYTNNTFQAADNTGNWTLNGTVAWNGSIWLVSGIFPSQSNKYEQFNTILSSTDGKNWTVIKQFNLDENMNTFSDMKWGGSIWVATMPAWGNNELFWSEDGVTWNKSTIHKDLRWQTFRIAKLAWNGSLWFAVGSPTTGNFGGGQSVPIVYSTDGKNWYDPSSYNNEGPLGRNINLLPIFYNDIGWNGSMWVAVGQMIPYTQSFKTYIVYSIDGKTWTEASVDSNNMNPTKLYSVTWNGSYWTAIGEVTKKNPDYGAPSWNNNNNNKNKYIITNIIATSYDGKTWQTVISDVPFNDNSKIISQIVLPYTGK